jgi:hypothetical protein
MQAYSDWYWKRAYGDKSQIFDTDSTGQECARALLSFFAVFLIRWSSINRIKKVDDKFRRGSEIGLLLLHFSRSRMTSRNALISPLTALLANCTSAASSLVMERLLPVLLTTTFSPKVSRIKAGRFFGTPGLPFGFPDRPF